MAYIDLEKYSYIVMYLFLFTFQYFFVERWVFICD